MNWLEPWRPIEDPARASALEAELYREVSDGHALGGIQVAAIGTTDHPDDVLFQLLDGSGRYATVHLTWKRGTSEWPYTRVFWSEADWLDRGLRADHEEYTEMQTRTGPA